MVHGIVHQSGGVIAVRSAPGQRSTFVVYLPEVRVEQARPDESGKEIRGGAERILVVDDEPIVVEIATRLLRTQGYTVLTAESGATALRVVEDLAHLEFPPARWPVHLVLTDVIMPLMSGLELGARLARRYPELPVLYTSGHPGEEIGRRAARFDGSKFIQKPFHPEELLLRVRAILDQLSASEAAPAPEYPLAD